MHERRKLARCHSGQNVSEGRTRPCWVLLFQGVEIEDRIGDVRSYRCHFLLAKDVPPGEFHEASALREAEEACFDEALAGEAVQHDVDPGATCRVEDFTSKRGRAAVEHSFDAERTEVGLLARARGCVHFRSCGLGQLDGRQPDAARAGVNQHAVPGLQPGKLE